MPKSNKLYAIVVLDKAKVRDGFLSELLDQEQEFDFSNILYISGNYKRVYAIKYLSYTKTWKTKAGAQKFLDTIIDHATQVENVGPHKGLRYRHPFDDWNLDSNGNRDWKEFKYEVWEITDEWNKDIERRIERETLNYKKKIESLEKQKIS